ncbi:LexA family protein [Vreelandella venusta]|uniref:LexA family protein n=1 Tax=Vreelandella venusta TaxID=44935 RepID=UPI00384DB3B0
MTICLPTQVTSHVPSHVLSHATSQTPSQPMAQHASRQRVAPLHTRQASTPHTVTRRNTYALRIRGDRMHNCNLFDGDVIIIHRHQHDTHQETAVATINQREVALKQLSISRLGIHLWPEDAAMPEVFLHNCDIQVLGMVMGVAHHATETRHH